MKIGELSRATGTPVETIRFYEREGLLLHTGRTSGNYRVYQSSQVQRLAFIRHCRSLDMTLDEVRVLLRFKDSPNENCGQVNGLLDEHIGHVASRIHELQQLQVQLRSLRDQCGAVQPTADCGILQELSMAANAEAEHVSLPAQAAVRDTDSDHASRSRGAVGESDKPRTPSTPHTSHAGHVAGTHGHAPRRVA
ncbi:MAG: Cd(II)/Pb(II)-responsive transcriptional regulator [Rhizobacter sp.]|nr:Cd(II)/Pb(II)-responsive transcriptional regulator [Rhizobacter sp.]